MVDLQPALGVVRECLVSNLSDVGRCGFTAFDLCDSFQMDSLRFSDKLISLVLRVWNCLVHLHCGIDVNVYVSLSVRLVNHLPFFNLPSSLPGPFQGHHILQRKTHNLCGQLCCVVLCVISVAYKLAVWLVLLYIYTAGIDYNWETPAQFAAKNIKYTCTFGPSRFFLQTSRALVFDNLPPHSNK